MYKMAFMKLEDEVKGRAGSQLRMSGKLEGDLLSGHAEIVHLVFQDEVIFVSIKVLVWCKIN
jgi:hypothetical protein